MLASGIVAGASELHRDDHDQDQPQEPSRAELRRRTKREESELKALARDLVQAPPRVLDRLDLTESLADALQDARLIHSPQAKQRALRRVRQWLRQEDWRALRGRLDSVYDGPSDAWQRARRWSTKLVAGGDPALDELMATHPSVDRRQIRGLVRNARRAPEERRARAERALAVVVAELLAGSSAACRPDEE